MKDGQKNSWRELTKERRLRWVSSLPDRLWYAFTLPDLAGIEASPRGLFIACGVLLIISLILPRRLSEFAAVVAVTGIVWAAVTMLAIFMGGCFSTWRIKSKERGRGRDRGSA